jgi:pyruvate/2-oxoglutarate dehydrogenase complex dihydrolipoamide dehydrogenase (E3) component
MRGHHSALDLLRLEWQAGPVTEAGTILPDDEHNRRLAANVRPHAYENPEPAARYNLVVLGAGTAGLVTAAGAAGLGAKVALVERHLMGGDCLNVGCVPSKAVIRPARWIAEVRRAGAFGARGANDVSLDFSAVMERMRRVRAHISRSDSVERFRGLGVDVFFGEGRFSGADAVEVGGKTLRFARAVIATGARAAAPPIEGLSDAGYLTNETVFSLTERPRRLAVIGAGAVGCELAQAFRRLGSDVTAFDILPQILGREDADAAGLIRRVLEREGVGFALSSQIRAIERGPEGKTLHFTVDGREDRLAVDEILIGAGRAPNVEGLGLDAVGVAFDAKRGVIVDDHLRTTNSRIFAAGDVCLESKFTHAADFAARIVIQNALFLGRKRVSALTMPWCTYTDPEVAHVGLYERDAVAKGIAVDTFMRTLAEVDRAVIDGEEEGFVKIHVRRGTDRLVGATIVASHAGDLVSEITLALTAGVGLGRLASVIHPYPTRAEAIRQLGDAYNRTRLTPLVKRLFAEWMRWTR